MRFLAAEWQQKVQGKQELQPAAPIQRSKVHEGNHAQAPRHGRLFAGWLWHLLTRVSVCFCLRRWLLLAFGLRNSRTFFLDSLRGSGLCAVLRLGL